MVSASLCFGCLAQEPGAECSWLAVVQSIEAHDHANWTTASQRFP
jgi:hypothetical protein